MESTTETKKKKEKYQKLLLLAKNFLWGISEMLSRHWFIQNM